MTCCKCAHGDRCHDTFHEHEHAADCPTRLRIGLKVTPDADSLARQSRLDEFAKAALTGILANSWAAERFGVQASDAARDAWDLAEAMEAERERRGRK